MCYMLDVISVEKAYPESLVFLANAIFNRNLDIFKRNVRGPTAPHTRALQLARSDTRHTAFQQQQRNTIHTLSTRTTHYRKKLHTCQSDLTSI